MQDFIAKFGGDAAQVTIAGESAGGGSVMYHALAAGGKLLGPRLFKNVSCFPPPCACIEVCNSH